ncbi:hypothetical protein CPC735_071470 [Paecilomyces variotii No. 5]|uniref:Aminoglycoside phosphotransferase domain-containing protein n=1 Tax=Byssochlamys spectabilis (strain No. 5 / NBRC 109023) TaxID=1356009 RepID=V5FSM3_BYSSN|nr:hypothetical protein CPC735_071470 [Paecilomyces variotii No. 5]
MQKAPGRPLEERWFDLTPKERVWTAYPHMPEQTFYGLPHDAHEGDDENRFCIGPSADYMFWRGKRALFGVDRKDPRDYVRSIGQQELEWTRKFGKPQQNDFPHNNILKGDISPTGYIDLLEQYISLPPYILPRYRGNSLNKPTLRHPDLSPSNVFISDSCEVSCIVDWQHSSILPLLLTAGNPPLFENPDSEPPKGLEKPRLPEDYASLSPEEKSLTDELHRRRMLFYLYMVFSGKDNKAHLDALRDPLLSLRQHAVDRAGRQWSGNIVTLKGVLLRLATHWDQLVHGNGNQGQIQCPVHFDLKEADEFLLLEDNWIKATILLEHWRSILDDPGQDGWVRHEPYEDVVEKNRQLQKEWLAAAEDEDDFVSVDRFWPFQDHEELD